jgi:hypothetical protein
MLEEAVHYVKFLQLQIKVLTISEPFLFSIHFSIYYMQKIQINYSFFIIWMKQLLSSEDMWMYAPIAYNGINIGLDLSFN